MSQFKPAAAPSCWGSKYQDGEKECDQCKYNDTCRPAMFTRLSSLTSDTRVSLPVLRAYAPPPIPLPPINYTVNQPMQTMVPLPSRPYYTPPAASLPIPGQPVHIVQPAQPQAPQYYQQSTGYSLPNPAQPNPMQPMHRPGAPSPAYYFTQYPGESVAGRVSKNILLRAAEAVFGELMQFFRHWTWPPN